MKRKLSKPSWGPYAKEVQRGGRGAEQRTQRPGTRKDPSRSLRPSALLSGSASRRRSRWKPNALLTSLALLCLIAPAAGQTCPGDCNGDGRVAVAEIITGVDLALGRAADCTAFDTDGSSSVSVVELLSAVGRSLHGCAIDRLAFVFASDFQTGAYATIGLDVPREVTPTSPATLLHNDAAVRVHDGLLYVVNRLLGDSIQVLDPDDGFATLSNCSTGGGTNPHDIAFAGPDKAYVTLYDQTELLIVDPSVGADCDGFLLGSVDLAEFADDDGLPEMDQMAIVGRKLYVALQRLDRFNFFAPAGDGVLAVVDTETDEVTGSVILSGGNPFGATKGLVVSGGAVVVAVTGAFGAADGGIERVDVETDEASGFFVTEEDLGGDVTDFVIVSPRRGYAVISNADFTNDVVAFDPESGERTATILSESDFVADIELDDRDELFVADRQATRPGIRIFRASDGTELTEATIDLGLPPVEIVFLP